MSADSGLATFRDSGGLWEGHDIEDVATVRGWERDPESVLAFYNKRRKQAFKATPNSGHKALAELEAHFDIDIITQNVDDLHEKAGSSSVLHLHGKLSEAKSSRTDDHVIDIGDREIQMGDTAKDGSQLRPNVVWFGEPVPNIEQASVIVSRADLLVIIGTSLVVYPAAGLVDFAPNGIPGFIIDPSEPQIKLGNTWTHISEPAEKGVPELKDLLISKYIEDNSD
ncbi:MAG TPA: Sir2 family NAD-dependent protein deacetylase [Balneolaceae bacterium]|nr:Sir2 family NAD-dependent protein deacetylase [Balneolaceae bacterium]